MLGGGQIKVKSNFVFLSIYPLFIILPHFPFSPLRQIPSPHYWTTFLSPSYPLCKQSLSSAPCRLRVGIVSPQPPRHSDATVTFTFRHFAWGLLLWSLATAVCSHPLNFIYPNLSDSWGGGGLYLLLGTKGQNTQTCTFSLPSMLSTVVCISPWKQPVQHRLHTAVHWFTASLCFEFVVAFLNWKCWAVTIHTTPSANIYTPLITISLGY